MRPFILSLSFCRFHGAVLTVGTYIEVVWDAAIMALN